MVTKLKSISMTAAEKATAELDEAKELYADSIKALESAQQNQAEAKASVFYAKALLKRVIRTLEQVDVDAIRPAKRKKARA